MSASRVYCRFCAEEKPYAAMAAITTPENRQSLIEKLSLFGIDFVDFSNKILPQTVCITCYELIKVSHEFILKVRRSQVVLSELCGLKVRSEIGLDTFSSFEGIKEENEDDGEYLQDEHTSNIENADSLVKKENFDSEDRHIFKKDTGRSRTSTDMTDTPVPRKPKKHQTWASYPWQCTICGTHEVSLTALRGHCQTEHRICFAFKCADCDDQLSGFREFVSHVRGHRRTLRNYCEYCNIKMEQNHKDSHSTDIHCNLCGAIFNEPSSLSSHIKDMNIIYNMNNIKDIQNWAEYPAVCQYCNLRAANKDELTGHCIGAHRRCFGNQCIDCGVNVDCFKDFLEHVISHRPVLRNICPYCNLDIGDDVSHIEEHSSKRHPCAVCGQIFHRKKRLRKHESTIDPSPLITPPKKRRKGPPTGKDTTCGVCGVIRKTPSSLWSHLLTHTERKRNYTCDRCGKAFYTKGSLVAHHKIHENSKEVCKICQKTFLTIARLKKHVKTHNLEMPFQCDHCQRFYNSKDRLREHVKVHMNVLPYQCQYCTKKFRHKTIMRTHENQHTGARPYSCNLCCMDFANWSNCNKHMKRKHGTTLAKNIMTPHGKLALNPQTGKPEQLSMDNVVKEWSEMMLGYEKRKKSLRIDTETGL